MSENKVQVAKTNDSSTMSKLSMCTLGYYHDPFLHYFVMKPSRRSPLINRGYYIRAKAIDLVITGFLKESAALTSGSQIVSLGAGFDTLYFRFKELLAQHNCKVYEVDFPSVMICKRDIILANQELVELVSPFDTTEGILKSSAYNIMGCDLTNLMKLDRLLLDCGIDYNLPSLVLSECVLTYIHPQKVNEILRWISKVFVNPLYCAYEQIYPTDGFGRMMQDHFVSIGSPLRNINDYPSKLSQEKRAVDMGFCSTASADMFDIFLTLSVPERKRIDEIEPFDEFEDMFLKFYHYLLLCAATGNCSNMPRSILPSSHTKTDVLPHSLIHADFLHLSKSSSIIQRYGHSSVCRKNGDIVLIGGFGIPSLSRVHGRLNDVLLFHPGSDSEVSTCKSLTCEGDVPMGIVYHKAVLLQDGSTLVTGGRGSPSNPLKDFFIITISDDVSCSWTRLKLDSNSDFPCMRWRHSATHFMHEGDEYVLLAGGRAKDGETLDDIFLLRCSNWLCKQLPIHLPERRHSHCAAEFLGKLIIIGGLTDEMVPLSTLCCISNDDSEGWILLKLVMNDPFTPRFSCASFTYQAMNCVVIFGGVGRFSDRNVSLLSVHNGEWRTSTYGVNTDLTVILHSMTTHVVRWKEIIVLGGGGNCFSFGTHFNQAPMELKLIA